MGLSAHMDTRQDGSVCADGDVNTHLKELFAVAIACMMNWTYLGLTWGQISQPTLRTKLQVVILVSAVT